MISGDALLSAFPPSDAVVRGDEEASNKSNGRKGDGKKVKDVKEDENSLSDMDAKAMKKKSKKGKKVVDPTLLGFSVTSSRIMMGEIHHVDD